MKALTIWITVSIGSFLLGWIASGPSDAPGHHEDPSPASLTNASRASRDGTRRTEGSELPDVDACRTLLASSQIRDSRHPLLRKLDRERALRRWISLDPDSAIKEAEANPSSSFSKDLFLSWVELNPSAALHRLSQGTILLKRAIATDVFVALFQKDARLAASALQSPSWKDKGTALLGWNFYQEVYRQWTLSDPSAAIATLPKDSSDLKHSSADSGQLAVLSEWAKTDLQGVWSYLFPDGKEAPFQVMWDAPQLLANGILGRADGASEILDAMIKGPLSERRHDIADAMVRINPREALAWADSRPADDPLRSQILAHAASDFATSDPERALEFLSESGGTEQTNVLGGPKSSYKDDSILRESFASLAARNPTKAVEMVLGLPADQRKGAMSGYLTNMFNIDPERAVEQCQSWLDDPALQSHLPSAWAESFSWSHGAGARDPGPMLEAIPALNDAVDGNVLSTWAKANPEAAAKWIQQRLDEGHPVKLQGEEVVADLAILEPRFTANWLTGLPVSDLQAQAANTLVANWAAFDPDAAQTWINSLPHGELRSSAEKGLTRTEGRR